MIPKFPITPPISLRVFFSILIPHITLFLIVIYVLAPPAEEWMSHYLKAGASTPILSEYTVIEQAAKFYLFVTILIAVYAYSQAASQREAILSISFLITGLTIYLSESNMIEEQIQPFFGVMCLLPTLLLLGAYRYWLGFLVFGLGCASIGMGNMIDLYKEQPTFYDSVPAFIGNILGHPLVDEEVFDVMGHSLFVLSAIFSFFPVVKRVMRNSLYRTLTLLTFSLMVTVGNGLIHHGYFPTMQHKVFAFVLSLIGFIGIIWLNQITSLPEDRLALGTPQNFYRFGIFFFLILPAYFTELDPLLSFLWLPILLLIALVLYHLSAVTHTSLRMAAPLQKVARQALAYRRLDFVLLGIFLVMVGLWEFGWRTPFIRESTILPFTESIAPRYAFMRMNLSQTEYQIHRTWDYDGSIVFNPGDSFERLMAEHNNLKRESDFGEPAQVAIEQWRASKYPGYLRDAGIDYLLVGRDWWGWLNPEEQTILSNPTYYNLVNEKYNHAKSDFIRIYQVVGNRYSP